MRRRGATAARGWATAATRWVAAMAGAVEIQRTAGKRGSVGYSGAGMSLQRQHGELRALAGTVEVQRPAGKRGSVGYSGAGGVQGQGRHNSRGSTEAAKALQATAAGTRGRAEMQNTAHKVFHPLLVEQYPLSTQVTTLQSSLLRRRLCAVYKMSRNE